MSQDKRRKPRNEPRNSPSSQPYQKNPPIWKVAIIQLLRGTIGVLENTVVNLETEAPPTAEKKPNFLERLFLGWDKFLQTFRLFLPSKVSNNVSDTFLTVILGMFAVVIVGTITFIFTSKPTEVATLPPVEEVPAPTSTPTPIIAPEPEPIPTSTPTPIIAPEPKPIPTSTPTPTIAPEPEPIPTSTPTPTIAPEPEPIPTLEPEPKEIIKLTPEQALIAGIENQLTEISVITVKNEEDEKIAVNLIKSIQANFLRSDLTIIINDTWYKLETPQQKQFAAAILQRSQELDFTHLQLVDSQNRLLARSPVVGNEMIFFVTQ